MNDTQANSHSSQDQNPYRSPVVENSVAIPPITRAELVRREHLNHESSVKAIGGLFLLGTGIWLVLGITAIVESFAGGTTALGSTPMTLLTALFAIALGVAGVGLRMLRPWGKGMCAVMCGGSIIAQLYAPGLGVILSAYILYLLFCKKGRMVFSQEYRQIIQETPHVRQRTSVVLWFVLAAFLYFLVTSLFVVLRR